MSWRLLIIAALSGVDGITGHTSMPDVPAAGDAWPVWAGGSPTVACGLVQTWHVLVLLPTATMADTVDLLDPLAVAVTAALTDIAEVSLCEPVTVQTGDGAGQWWPALRFILTTAGEAM